MFRRLRGGLWWREVNLEVKVFFLEVMREHEHVGALRRLLGQVLDLWHRTRDRRRRVRMMWKP